MLLFACDERLLLRTDPEFEVGLKLAHVVSARGYATYSSFPCG